jgi:chemotaxis protein MotB
MRGLDDDDGDTPAEGNPIWMTTFSDLCMLLLTFFVLLLSFAETDVKGFKSALGSMHEAFGVQYLRPGSVEAMADDIVTLSDTEQAASLVELQARATALFQSIQRTLEGQGLEDSVEVEETQRGLVLRLKDHVVFDSGSDRLKPEADPILERLAELAGLYPEGVSIEGHTDNRPIQTARFPSNWELSTSRAIAMFNGLRRFRNFERQRIRVIGYGQQQPVATNDTEEGRARNRRVEFVFERPDEMDHSWPGIGRERRERDAADLESMLQGAQNPALDAPAADVREPAPLDVADVIGPDGAPPTAPDAPPPATPAP